jgi:hypothetical protein
MAVDNLNSYSSAHRRWIISTATHPHTWLWIISIATHPQTRLWIISTDTHPHTRLWIISTATRKKLGFAGWPPPESQALLIYPDTGASSSMPGLTWKECP